MLRGQENGARTQAKVDIRAINEADAYDDKVETDTKS